MPMNDRKYVLGIDTSNYTTSAAVTDDSGRIISDERRMLSVKKGERGLRQQEALFQHISEIDDIIEKALSGIDRTRLAGVAYSERPRPVEGSYMPVFKAGKTAAGIIASVLQIPCMAFSHQEGHVEAARHGGPLEDEDEFLCWHLSGGTCELLRVKCENGIPSEIEIIGGTKDISFGQLIDRTGIALGIGFPCGRELDSMTLRAGTKEPLKGLFTRIKCIDDSAFFNVTGTETQMLRFIEENGYDKDDIPEQAVYTLFDTIAECIFSATARASDACGISSVLFSGGVASSTTLKEMLLDPDRRYGRNKGAKDLKLYFGDASLSSDNAAGISLLGGKRLWR